MDFQLVSDYKPRGDQAEPSGALRGHNSGESTGFAWRHGSGKTFTMAKIIEELNRPAFNPGAQQDACRAALP